MYPVELSASSQWQSAFSRLNAAVSGNSDFSSASASQVLHTFSACEGIRKLHVSPTVLHWLRMEKSVAQAPEDAFDAGRHRHGDRRVRGARGILSFL